LPALVRGEALEAELVELQTGNALDAWQRLADQLKASSYAAIIHDGASEAKTQAITELVRDLHRHTRAVALPLGASPNAVGAAQVLTWQTGFPAAVSFARGYPQHLPDEATAVRLMARREVDAALILAADPLPNWPKVAADHLRSIPSIVIDDRQTATSQAATIAMRAATFGIATPGSVYRSDGVVLPLRPAVNSPLPSTADVLALLAVQLGS
jgi:formylmethanofuran dehydrogenase subunit B